MKITVKGTSQELETAKWVIDSTCFFDGKFCSDPGCNKCTECIKKNNLKVEYTEEDKK